MNTQDDTRETSLSEVYNKISIQQYKTDMGFKALVEGVHDNLYVIPVYQRKYRWTKKQVEELATSLIRDLPIPPIYTFRNKNGQLEILDGQQRVMSLYFYFIGKFFEDSQESVFDYQELDIDGSQNFEGALEKKYHIVPTKFYMTLDKMKCDISYATLPKEIKRKIDYTTISIVEIKTSMLENSASTLHKIFTNLNNGGKRLSNQELRNGIYPCSFGRMIDEINRTNKKWRDLYGHISDECSDMEKLYRFCAMKKMVDFDGENFQVNGDYNTIKDFIDYFAEQAFYFSDEEIKEYKDCLEKFIGSLEIQRKNFQKILLTEGIFVVLEKTNINVKITDKIYDDISIDNVIKKTMSAKTFSKVNMNKRWKRIHDLLSKYDVAINNETDETGASI